MVLPHLYIRFLHLACEHRHIRCERALCDYGRCRRRAETQNARPSVALSALGEPGITSPRTPRFGKTIR